MQIWILASLQFGRSVVSVTLRISKSTAIGSSHSATHIHAVCCSETRANYTEESHYQNVWWCFIVSLKYASAWQTNGALKNKLSYVCHRLNQTAASFRSWRSVPVCWRQTAAAHEYSTFAPATTAVGPNHKPHPQPKVYATAFWPSNKAKLPISPKGSWPPPIHGS